MADKASLRAGAQWIDAFGVPGVLSWRSRETVVRHVIFAG